MKHPVKHPMLVLALAGVLLSTLMAIAATKPAGLWLLAFFALRLGVVGVGSIWLTVRIGRRLGIHPDETTAR